MIERVEIGDAVLYCGVMEAVLPTLPAECFDSVVCDPPYGLRFMGKQWDYDVPTVEQWREVFRVLKPGGHVLAFGGTRTYHRLVCAVEDAGFEVRDMVSWVYGSGFPKSLDVSKAIDKAAGAEREVVGIAGRSGVARSCMAGDVTGGEYMATAPATEAARQWAGWGTALKPSVEPCVLARKPLIGTVVENVLRHGTGAINVDGCRVGNTVETWPKSRSYHSARGPKPRGAHGTGDGQTISTGNVPAGRFPANLIHDGSPGVVGLFPESKSGAWPATRGSGGISTSGHKGHDVGVRVEASAGSAARFFYCAKASRAERADSKHPTVKPVDLMRYLCRLITPPGGTVLDPWAGSGTTGEAAVLEGFRAVLIERDAVNEKDIRHRLERSQRQGRLFVDEPAKPEQAQLFGGAA